MKKILCAFVYISFFIQVIAFPNIIATPNDVYKCAPPEVATITVNSFDNYNSPDISSTFAMGDTTTSTYKTTRSFEGEYFEANFSGTTLTATGKILSSKPRCMINIYDSMNDEAFTTASVEVKSNKYSLTANLSSLAEGTYYISLFFNTVSTPTKYQSAVQGIPFYVTASEIIFEIPFTSDENIYYKSFLDDVDIDLNYYLQIPESEFSTPEQYQEIANKASLLTSSCTTNYEKILAIHDYVAKNVYYDYIALENDDITQQGDPWFVFENNKGVCTGYSRLMRAMLVSLGIPTACILGYANSATGLVWDENISYERNHEWNWVYCSELGRWMTIDATWDCGNKYKEINGIETLIDGDINYMYFDADDDAFSITHLTDGMRRNDAADVEHFIVAIDNIEYALADKSLAAFIVYGSPNTLSIKSNINGCDITSILKSFMAYDASVVTLTIPSSVTLINAGAFYGTKMLESVYCYAEINSPIDIESGVFLAGKKTPTIYCHGNSYLYDYLEEALIAYNDANVNPQPFSGATLSRVILFFDEDGEAFLDFTLSETFAGGKMHLAYYENEELVYFLSDEITNANIYNYDGEFQLCVSNDISENTVIKLFIWENNMKPFGSRTIKLRK